MKKKFFIYDSLMEISKDYDFDDLMNEVCESAKRFMEKVSKYNLKMSL